MKLIDRTQYPELNLILWDTAAKFIEPKDALNKYELRWRFIDKENMTRAEKILLDELVEQYGNGIFLSA